MTDDLEEDPSPLSFLLSPLLIPIWVTQFVLGIFFFFKSKPIKNVFCTRVKRKCLSPQLRIPPGKELKATTCY